MYNNQAAVQTDAVKETLASSLGNRFILCNNTQSELITLIEDKLHMILNKRQPTKQSEGGTATPILNDFAQGMDKELNVVSYNNGRLENILSHLREII